MVSKDAELDEQQHALYCINVRFTVSKMWAFKVQNAMCVTDDIFVAKRYALDNYVSCTLYAVCIEEK